MPRCPFRWLLAAALALTVPWTAPGPAAATPNHEMVERLVRQGDEFYRAGKKKGKIEPAIEAYQKAIALDDRYEPAYWKLARAIRYQGEQIKGSKGEADLYREGIEYAKMAVELDPRSAAAHFWLGLLYGLFGRARGMMQSLHLIDPLKHEMEAVIAIDPAFEDGGAYRVLGRMYWAIPHWLGGDTAKSIDYLRKAVEVGPDDVDNHLMLAESCISAGEKNEARVHVDWVFKQGEDPAWAEANKSDLRDARRLRAKLEGGGRHE